MLTIENVNNGDLVFILLTNFVKSVRKLENVFVHILFKNYVNTSMLTNNLGQIDGKNLPELPASRIIDDRFCMLYNHVRSTQAYTRKNRFIKTIVSHGLLITCFVGAILAMMQ